MKKISILGPIGTFSDKAYKKYHELYPNLIEDYEPYYYKSIDDVFFNLEDGLGIIPIENSLDGYVQRTLDLLLEQEAIILDELCIPVEFSLVSNAKNIKDIKRLFVQFKANGQCRKFISTLNNIDIISTDNNIESFDRCLKGECYDAAIVPHHIIDNLDIKDKLKNKLIIENVTDASLNQTRFILITHNKYLITEIDNQFTSRKKSLRVPVYILPKIDYPGLLFNLLKSFNEENINLISIMSRPRREEGGVIGSYNFYLEIEAKLNQKEQINNLFLKMQEKNDEAIEIKILGFYSV